MCWAVSEGEHDSKYSITRWVLAFGFFALAATSCTTSSPSSSPPSTSTPTPAQTEETGHQLVGDIGLERAPSPVAEQCQRTANTLRYPVPCPQLLPSGTRPSPVAGPFASSKEASEFIHRGYDGFREFVLGDLTFPAAGTSGVEVPNTNVGHLVISGAPGGVDLRHLLYGPAAESDDPLVHVGSTRLLGVQADFLQVVPSNSNSILQNHLALTWFIDGHFYAIGFHGWTEESHALDLAVAESVVMVSPQ